MPSKTDALIYALRNDVNNAAVALEATLVAPTLVGPEPGDRLLAALRVAKSLFETLNEEMLELAKTGFESEVASQERIAQELGVSAGWLSRRRRKEQVQTLYALGRTPWDYGEDEE